MLVLLKGPFLGLIFSYCINDPLDDAICNIVIYADDTTLYSKCDQASDLWQQLELASEFESDLTEARSGLLISMLKRLSLVLFTSVITLSLLM